MAVQEFECQLARGQIGRYLGGETLSSDLLRQLGAHVSECQECREFLDKKRNSLKGLLAAEQEPAPQPVERPIKQAPITSAVVGGSAATLISKLREKTTDANEERKPQPQAQAPTNIAAKKTIFTKPLLLCGALALVLIGMSYVSHNPTSLFGPKVAALDATSTHKPITAPTPTPEPSTEMSNPAKPASMTPAPSVKTPNAPIVTTSVLPATSNQATPKPTVPAETPAVAEATPKANIAPPTAPKPRTQAVLTKPTTTVKRKVRIVRRRRPLPHSRIRVYDASGNVIP